jgi:hypothetical protein
MAKANVNLRKGLKNRMRFEMLISDISVCFMRLAFNEIDSEIARALKQILDFFAVDCCGVLGIRENKKFVWLTHACYAKSIKPVSKEINLAELFPWSYEKQSVNFVVGLPRSRGIVFLGVERIDAHRPYVWIIGIYLSLNANCIKITWNLSFLYRNKVHK